MKKLVIFTNNKCKFNIVWNARNIRSLSQIKDNVTTALFMKVIARVVRTMLVNP